MIIPTAENSNSITKLAALIGWTPDELADQHLGALQGFLGAI